MAKKLKDVPEIDHSKRHMTTSIGRFAVRKNKRLAARKKYRGQGK